ncbi:hypothetical protein AGMMS49942_28600 [Spirochaetia bacterium]|nr:hypothetical protein AGMMS49942_28600 [Spirochaetia bacterium]
MKNNRIEQSLHGYDNGHHLLAISTKGLNNNSLKTLSILSDFSGPEIVNGFEEYITGYPLVDDDLYVIAKTWYAFEMERPGCVWTHSLFIPNKIIKTKMDVNKLFNLFIRPKKNTDISLYSKSLMVIDEDNDFYIDDMSLNDTNLLFSSLFSNNQPVLIGISDTLKIQNEIIFLLQNELYLLYKYFSFCTGSVSDRKINNRSFDLQFVPEHMLKYIGRNIKNPILINKNNVITNMPNHFIDITYKITNDDNFNKFMLIFNNLIIDRVSVGQFIQFYFEIGLNTKICDIIMYIKKGKEIFNDDCYNKFIIKTIECLLDNDNSLWFIKENINDIIKIISSNNNLSIDNFIIKNIISLLWEKYDIRKIGQIFNELINSNVNNIGEKLIKVIANNLTIEKTQEFSLMQLKTCRILVLANNKLSLCPDFWKQTIDFQLEILNCINKEKLSVSENTKLIKTILENSQDVFCLQLYNIFDKMAVSIVLSYYAKHNIKNGWIKIIHYDMDEYFNWIITIDKLDDYVCIEEMINGIDPNSEQLLKYECSLWEKLFQLIDTNNINDKLKVSLAIYFLPIILHSGYKYSSNLVHFVFYTINDKLANDSIDFESWSKIDKLLPEISWYASWDRCKRLRKAFKNSGYSFKSEYYFD